MFMKWSVFSSDFTGGQHLTWALLRQFYNCEMKAYRAPWWKHGFSCVITKGSKRHCGWKATAKGNRQINSKTQIKREFLRVWWWQWWKSLTIYIFFCIFRIFLRFPGDRRGRLRYKMTDTHVSVVSLTHAWFLVTIRNFPIKQEKPVLWRNNTWWTSRYK